MLSPIAGKRIGLLSARASRANGGVFEAIVNNVALLRSLGAVPVVVALADEQHGLDVWRLADAEIHLSSGSGPSQLAYSPDLPRRLHEAQLDLLHLHGIWQFPSRAACGWARRTGRPLIVSPHGMLDPWITRRNAWKKELARVGWEKTMWKRATAFHALTEAEASDIERETGSQRIAVIPNAAPPPGPRPTRMPGPAALYLGRIHEKKNILALVDGWLAALPDLPTDATLTIAGWGENEGIEALEATLADCGPSVHFVGAAFGSQKAALLDVSRFLVLPSLSEGLPMVILEAWAAGVPTIMSEACGLPEGFAAGAAIDSGTDPQAIASAFRDAFSRNENEWLEMSKAAQQLAVGPFGQAAIARHWEEIYSELLIDQQERV
ncbi:glycosyltransferase [Erythrobacter mangrovi]|uniref:Glycosyltransferase n=1 Tax=Erythrobacter mangrovi TaxID=2739433 RepID=A0A7D4AV76_9SPHN|nr:glycosyltransferase [Erythrobacter mangrovi]QKG72457.1 glycosyltransferase [Erythrobacter mangrovi]